jgi:hypothetical protein
MAITSTISSKTIPEASVVTSLVLISLVPLAVRMAKAVVAQRENAKARVIVANIMTAERNKLNQVGRIEAMGFRINRQ